MKRFYRLKAHYSILEPNEKPPTDVVHHEIGHRQASSCYQTLNNTCFTQETPFNMVCSWTREFHAMFDRSFSFFVYLPFSKFIFTYQVQPIIEEVDYDVEVVVDPDALAIKVYDPPPLMEYVQLIESELLKNKKGPRTSY